MLLRHLFEAPEKTAVVAFGRMNPPTIGHQKLVDKLKSIPGDHYVFLSHTQNPKKNPLDFQTKVKFAEKFFPGVTIGDPNVRTPIDAMKKIDSLGYDRVVFVAGSDREADFSSLFEKYNGKEYTFDSIQVVSAGERDPDADGAEGMSASKMRAAAASGNLEAFAQGVPEPRLAKELYDAVRRGMGVQDKQPEPQESVKEASYSGNIGIIELMKFFAQAKEESPELATKVKNLIKQKKDSQVWKIVQDYTGTTLQDKEFNESINSMLIAEAMDIKRSLEAAGSNKKLTHDIRALMLDAADRIKQLEVLCGKGK